MSRMLRYLIPLTYAILTLVSLDSYGWSTSNSSGDWNQGSTWQSGTVPVTGDGVSINAGHTITYTGNLTWPSSQIGISGKLIVNGNLTINNGVYLYVNTGGEIVVTGDLILGSTFSPNGKLTVGKNLTVNGEFSANTTAQVKVSGNVVVSNNFNNNCITDIDGNLTVTSGQVSANSGGILAVDGNLTANNQVAAGGVLVVAGDYVNDGGPSYASGNQFYVLGTKTCNSNPETCSNIKSETQWISESSPANQYISTIPSWWTNHLANSGQSDGPTNICPESTSNLSVLAVSDDAGAITANLFEWAVYGGTIISTNGTAVSSNNATIDNHNAAYQSVRGINGTTTYTIAVKWETGPFPGAYVAVRQTSEFGCTDGKWSVYKINITSNNAAGPASSTPTVCVGTAISAITHTTSGATGLGVPTELPNGVSASWSPNLITISGTPTASGTFNYTVPLTGGCGTVSATGTITVNPRPTPTFLVAPDADECAQDNVIYTTQPGQSNYVWNVPGVLNTDYTIIAGGIGSTNSSVTLKWISSGSKTVSVNYSNSNGCIGVPAQTTTDVHPVPQIGSFN